MLPYVRFHYFNIATYYNIKINFKKTCDLENATLSTNMMNLCEFMWMYVKFPGCIDACNALRQERSLKQ